jgi:NAD(P)-dependent dehydrogenase (short-subunit alcohol dehydrogenase family)
MKHAILFNILNSLFIRKESHVCIVTSRLHIRYASTGKDMSASPVILVTAGSAGLGSAVARLFAHHGYRVVINYNTDSERARTLIAELSAQHAKLSDVEGIKTISRYISIQADLASALEIRRLLKETYAAMGRIDVVLSNGG